VTLGGDPLEIGRFQEWVLRILSWNLSNALNWNSTASRELLLPLKLREEDRARDPVVGNISLHLFISEHTAQERNHLFHGFEYCVRERTRSSL
jgi:hypothetical protein